MNPSRQYVSMCSLAPELKEHKPQEGDLYALPNGAVFTVASYCFRVENAQPRVYLAIPSKIEPSQIHGEPDFESPVIKKRDFELYPLKFWIWLPSIEQLQGMVMNSDLFNYIERGRNDAKPRLDNLLMGFEYFYRKQSWFGMAENPNLSMRELWLSFIRKIRFDEIWDSKTQRWIKDNSS